MALQFQNYNFIGDNFANGGVQLKSALTNFKDNESPECKNVFFSQTGSVQKRKGFSKLNPVQIVDSALNIPTVTGIYQHRKSDGTVCTIVGSGTDLFNGVTAPVSIKAGQTAGALYDFSSINDFAIIVNGADPNLKYDCAAITGLGIDPPGAVPTFNANIVGANLSFPGFYKYVVTFVNAEGEESNPSAESAIIPTIAVTQDLRINISISADPQVTSRNIYRTTTDGVNPGAIFFLAGTVADNVTTTFDDHTSDVNLGLEVEFDNDKPPVLKFIETHKNRLFGVEAANPNRLRFSKQFRQDQWPVLNFIDVSPGDGDNITSIVSFFDQLVIFKRETIYVLSGNDETDFIVQKAQTDSRIGALSNRTVAVLDNMVAFLSERGVYGFDGLRTKYLSSNLEAIFDKKNPNQTRIFNWTQEAIAVATNYKNASRNWYFLCIPTGSAQQNNLVCVFDYTLGNWTLFDGILAHSLAVVEESNEPKLYSGDYNGFLWKQDNTTNDGFSHTPSFSTSGANTAFTLRDETQAEVLSTATSGAAFTLTDLSVILLSGTATAGGVNTLTDSFLAMTPNQFVGEQLYIQAGTGVGQYRRIISNTATVFTVNANWTIVPDATSVYQVGGFPINGFVSSQIYIQAGTGIGQARTISSNTADTVIVSVAWGVVPDATSQYIIGGWTIDILKGVRVKIVDGLGEDQIRTIASNTAVEFTITMAWSTIPDTTSEYSIGFIEAEWQSRWFHYNIPEFMKRLMYIHVNAHREGNYSLEIGIRFDFLANDTQTVLKSLALSGSDSVWDVSIWDSDFWDSVSQTITRITNDPNHIHRYVQILFRNDRGRQPFTVDSFNLVYQVKGVRR